MEHTAVPRTTTYLHRYLRLAEVEVRYVPEVDPWADDGSVEVVAILLLVITG